MGIRVLDKLDKAILGYLRLYEAGVTRSFLGEELKIARTTLYDHLDKLRTFNIVSTYPFNHGKGRPWTMWQLN